MTILDWQRLFCWQWSILTKLETSGTLFVTHGRTPYLWSISCRKYVCGQPTCVSAAASAMSAFTNHSLTVQHHLWSTWLFLKVHHVFNVQTCSLHHVYAFFVSEHSQCSLLELGLIIKLFVSTEQHLPLSHHWLTWSSSMCDCAFERMQDPAPRSDWLDSNGPPWTSDTHKCWLNKLGNLCLLTKSQNSSNCNESFQVKQQRMFSNQEVTGTQQGSIATALGNHDGFWNEAAVQAQHSMHLQTLACRWGMKDEWDLLQGKGTIGYALS